MLVTVGFITYMAGDVPRALSIVALLAGVVGLVVAGSIRQRWEVVYRGHQIRFENSPLTGERLFLDGGMVSRGGVGMKMELRAPIRVGEGAGDEIMALVGAPGDRVHRLGDHHRHDRVRSPTLASRPLRDRGRERFRTASLPLSARHMPRLPRHVTCQTPAGRTARRAPATLRPDSACRNQASRARAT